MIKPNFSESQLQQMVNTEITMRLYSGFHPHTRWWFHPIMINLVEEGELGWDSAFYFPWLLIGPNNNGANFFIQYKLSKLIEGKSGKEYKNWNESYLRFKIPYTVKDKLTNKYSNDFSQYNALKKLANKGFAVHYATNHIIDKTELFNLASNQTLLNEIPFLDISSMNNLHEKITFTKMSKHFLLHSEIEEQNKAKWNEMILKLKEKEKRSLSEDTKILKEFIIEFEKEMDVSNEGSFSKKIDRFANYEDKKYIESFLIAKYLRLYLDCYWYRI